MASSQSSFPWSSTEDIHAAWPNWWLLFNPLKPSSSNYYTFPYDILALWFSALSASVQMSEIKNGRLGLYGTEHSKCECTMTLGFKGLTMLFSVPGLTGSGH